MDTTQKKLKIGFYNPYFDSLGGGERYVLTLAEHWSKTHDVSVFWDDKTFIEVSEERFGLDLSRIHVIPNVFAKRFLVKKLIESASFDVLFFLSDGSIPTSLAKHNILHFQVPFQHIAMSSWKAKRYDIMVLNSQFTRREIDPTIPIPALVIYPPVDLGKISSKPKAKQILSVGRFNGLYGAKKQEILIDAFRQLKSKKKFVGWKLILAGGCLPTDEAYLNGLREQAKGYAIEFTVNCPYSTLQTLYETSAIYWHAAGFGETKPEHMEHFGITTVESMMTGCIPIVFSGGGQTEIVQDGKNGYTWETIQELLIKTERVVGLTDKRKTMIGEAKKTTQRFSKQTFTREFDRVLKRICG